MIYQLKISEIKLAAQTFIQNPSIGQTAFYNGWAAQDEAGRSAADLKDSFEQVTQVFVDLGYIASNTYANYVSFISTLPAAQRDFVLEATYQKYKIAIKPVIDLEKIALIDTQVPLIQSKIDAATIAHAGLTGDVADVLSYGINHLQSMIAALNQKKQRIEEGKD